MSESEIFLIEKKIEFLDELRESEWHPFTLSKRSEMGCENDGEKEKRNG